MKGKWTFIMNKYREYSEYNDIFITYRQAITKETRERITLHYNITISKTSKAINQKPTTDPFYNQTDRLRKCIT